MGQLPDTFTAKELWNDDVTRPERKLMILSLTAVIHLPVAGICGDFRHGLRPTFLEKKIEPGPKRDPS